MSSFQVTAVRTEQPYGASHEHITHVKLSTDTAWTRATIIRDIKEGHAFYTYADGAEAEVIVAGCPYCSFGEYITTEPDWTTANNLLSLPRF